MVVKYILQAVAGISVDESRLCSEGRNNLLDNQLCGLLPQIPNGNLFERASRALSHC